MVDPIYLLDSDVFITVKNLYYSFKICPGFWKPLLHHHRGGRVYSIDQVRSELLSGQKTEDLVKWVKNKAPDGFFLRVDTIDVMDAYKDIMIWVERHARYSSHAKDEFAMGADGWLVAYARAHGAIVVTNERSAPESKKATSCLMCVLSLKSSTTTRSPCCAR